MPEADSSGPAITVAAAREDPDSLPPEINTNVAHSARVYNYWLGGKDNISQVLFDVPHNARADVIQARHVYYSKIATLTVRALSGTYMGVMSEFSDGRS
jgi:hypothetical protein